MSDRPLPPAARAALHLGLGLLVVASVLPDPLGSLLGSGRVDVWNHAWGVFWWAEELSAGELPWYTELLNWPLGGSLFFIDPFLALLSLPLLPVLGVAGAWNVALWLEVSFASWAAHRLARALGAASTAAWVASAAYAASAWVICELHNGISEAVNIGPVALALALCEEAVQARTARAWVLAGLGLGLSALASPYLGLGVGVVLLLRGLPHLRHAWAGGLVGLLTAALPTLLLRAQLGAVDAIVKRPEGMNEQLALHNATDLRTFVAPFGFRSVDLSAEDMEHSMYLGLVALGLALVAAWRAPRRVLPWLAVAAVAVLLSLGPWLYWGDGWVTLSSGARLALPWAYLQQAVPGLAITHPLRLAVPALAIVAGAAAVGAGALLGRRAVLLAPLVLLDGLLISGAPWPIATADGAFPAVHADLVRPDGVPPTQAVLDLPTDAGPTMVTSRYLYWQTGHRQPIPYAVDARASTSPLLFRPAFQELAALCARREDEAARLQLRADTGKGARMQDLARDGIRWIVVHRDLDPEVAAALETRIRRDLGPGEVVGDAVRWDLGQDVRRDPGGPDALMRPGAPPPPPPP